MPFSIIRQDITRMKVDAIVNAANTDLLMGGGVCGAIFHAAGAAELQAACDLLSPVPTGQAAITPGFQLPARYVIHAVGPVYHQWEPSKSEELLRSAYACSLRLAREHRCKSIAFPLISSGIYGYPKEGALQVAVSAIRDFLAHDDMEVFLVIFDRDSFVLSDALLESVSSYLDRHYEEEPLLFRCTAPVEAPCPMELKAASAEAVDCSAAPKLEDWIDDLEEPFSTTLLHLIDAKGRSDVEVYKKANLDRKLFSKIRNGKNLPSKRTALALAIALELTLEETDDLLERAGYALSHSQKFDVIVEYFIVNGRYDIFEINEMLFRYEQPLLGAG